jgi:hypothetical protein
VLAGGGQWRPQAARSQVPGVAAMSGFVTRSAASKDMNAEAEEPKALGAVTKQQQVKTQHTEEISACHSEL